MYLQLAENKQGIEQFYIPVPTGNGGHKLVREDLFDDLSDQEFSDYLDALEAAGLGSAAKKAARQERKAARKETKQSKKDAKVEKKESKNEARITKAQAKGAGGGGWKDTLNTIAGAVGTVTGGGEKISGSVDFDSGGTPPADEEKKPPYALYIGGGIAALVIVGLLLSKKKK